MNTWIRLLAHCALPLMLAMVGCGDATVSSPASPSPGEGSAAATVTLTSSGVEPKSVTVSAGQAVMFVNNDSVAHDMASDPHPVHNDCPPINRVGRLDPGQSMQTDAMTAARSCGFHDLLRDGDARWHGTIVVQ